MTIKGHHTEMLQTLLAIKGFFLILGPISIANLHLIFSLKNQIKLLQDLGNHLFMVTQRKPFKVFKVVSIQEPSLP